MVCFVQIAAGAFFCPLFSVAGMFSEKGKGSAGETVRIRKTNGRKFMIKLLCKLSLATFSRIKTMIEPH